MYVRVDNTIFIVKFSYYTPDEYEQAFRESTSSRRISKVTECKIFKIDASNPDKKLTSPLSYATASCAEGDPFVKRIGRWIAFSRATKHPSLRKNERTALWDGFLSQTKALPKPVLNLTPRNCSGFRKDLTAYA